MTKNYFDPIKNFFFEHKKICIIALCIIAILVLCISIFATSFAKQDKKVEFITINSRDNLFSLTIPTNLNYTVGNSSNNLSLDLYDNAQEVYIYGNTIEISREIDLIDVINEDKISYFSSKENATEVASIHELKINNFSAYEYSMTYKDAEYGKDFYCTVIWIQTENHIFILNFEVPNEKAEQFTSVFEEIKSSFKLLEKQ